MTTIATSLPQDELAQFDEMRRDQGLSRAEAIREALRLYVRWADLLPSEDLIAEELDP
jgi:metal-responsive CopG/Arc/MetJ family transcriptional regulator